MYKNILITVLAVLCIAFAVETHFLYEAIEVQDETIDYVTDLYETEKESVKVIIGEPDNYQVAENLYSMDRYLIEAIERHESSNYQSDLYVKYNNSWGAKNSDGSFKSFDSAEQSVMELARCLRIYYFDKDLDELEEIASKFAPNNVKEWVEDVGKIYTEISGYIY